MKVFKDKVLQDKFDKDGFVKLQFLDQKTIEKLLILYKEIQPVSYPGFSSTIYNPNIEVKKETSKRISNLLDERIKREFMDFRSLGGNFLCKTSGPESFLQTHQDWTIVDEAVFESITIWMPLIDTSEENGALRVLPGSHKFSQVLRSPTLPGAFNKILNEAYHEMILVPMKAGEAIVFNHALLHASGPNMSGSDRVIAIYGLVPQEAQLFFFHRAPTGKVEKYKIADDFFLTYNNIGSVPEFSEKTDEFEYVWQDWNIGDLKSAISNHDNESINVDLIAEKDSNTSQKNTPEKDINAKSSYSLVNNIKEIIMPIKSFLRVYTPINILREIRSRLVSR